MFVVVEMIMKTAQFFQAVVAAAALATASLGVAQTDAITGEDKEFLKNASEMGWTEVELGKLAVEKGTAPDVKALGSKMVADHNKANADLIILAKQKGVELGHQPTVLQKRMLAAFEGKTGAEFDKEFREHARKDHEKAIKTFTDAAKDSKDPDVKAYAAKNLAMLQEHLAMAGGAQKP